MSAGTNVNLNTVGIYGNTGRIPAVNLGIISAVVLVPAGTTIPASAMVSQAAFQTYIAGKFINDTRSSRWFAFTSLDKFTDETKKTASEDTGRYQLDVFSFPSKFSFRYMQGIGNFVEATKFQNCQGQYDYFFVDTSGVWWGTADTTGAGGLSCYTNQQFYIPNWMPRTVSTDAQFFVNVSLANQTQINGNFRYYEANSTPDAFVMLENAILTDVSSALGTPLTITTTTDIVFTVKYGQDSRDFVKDYQASITKACFIASNLTLGTTLTISSITMGNIVVAGQSYFYVWAILSAAPTSGNVVQIKMAAPSVVNGIITSLPNVVCEIIDPSANAANAAVHTFA